MIFIPGSIFLMLIILVRFIPLYTRLKAHSDSVTMEKRIFPETMFRIMQSLQNSCADFQQDSKKSGLGRGTSIIFKRYLNFILILCDIFSM